MRVFKQKFKKVDEFRTTEVKFPKTYQRKKKIKTQLQKALEKSVTAKKKSS